MIKIQCTKKDCLGLVAFATERGYVEILRRRNRPEKTSVRVTGRDFTVLANCHNTFCHEVTTISVENGLLKKEGLRIAHNEPKKEKKDVQKPD